MLEILREFNPEIHTYYLYQNKKPPELGGIIIQYLL
jgi:hypothetical protein